VPASGLRFGPSGIPKSTPRPGTPAGIQRVRELGLDCLEMAWGNGVKMGPEMAGRIRAAAEAHGVELTAHAPYFVNLCGDAEVVKRSERRLLEALRLARLCGARSVVFHPGYYTRRDAGRAAAMVARRLKALVKRSAGEGERVELRPELTGRVSQLGTLDETLAWCESIPELAPCLDFAHLYARGQGAPNRYEDFAAVLAAVRSRLGEEALRRVHVHVSGIEFGPAGERRHRPVRESRFRWRELLRALKDAGAAGRVVAETPAQEADALLLQRTYRRMR
jgi:deoxyribonuclease-4